MSAIVTKAICSIMMAVTGLIVVKTISNSEIKLTSIRSISLLLCVIAIPITNYGVEYTYFSTISIYLMTIFAYKYILDIQLTKAFIADSILMIFMLILDYLISLIFSPFGTIDILRKKWYVNILSNIIMSIGLLILFHTDFIKNKISRFVQRIEQRKYINVVIFFIITVVSMSGILYLFFLDCKLDLLFTTNSMILVILFLLTIILIGERNNYDKLFTKYDNLFNYVKVFEDWIENEQLTRHEYKNQLAVLRCMTKEKEVKEKIDSIISGNINIDEQMISQLKYLPSGGFKGLLYYKIAVARNNKINIDVDISADVSTRLKRFNKAGLEILSKLIGIYCDNAIEAAKETRKKIVVIEIYEYNKMVHVVISNTFNKKKDISRRYEKGVSTKGPGRGNGLYFANKLISKNKWIEEKQDIIDNFYIQKISVTKMVQNRKNGKKKKKK